MDLNTKKSCVYHIDRDPRRSAWARNPPTRFLAEIPDPPYLYLRNFYLENKALITHYQDLEL